MKTFNKKKLILSAAFLISVSFICIFFNFIFSVHGNKIKKIRINETIIWAETVASEEKQHLGLIGRKKFCSNCGMIFEFENPGLHTFTMRGMNFPLDIVWINGNKIVDISKNVPVDTRTISPGKKVDRVLEIPSGTCEIKSIKIGDQIY